MRAAHWLTYWGLTRRRERLSCTVRVEIIYHPLFFFFCASGDVTLTPESDFQRGQTQTISLTVFSLSERSCEAKQASNRNDLK